jgi:small subunit ribosomal protein S6
MLNNYDAMIIFESSMSEEGLQKALGRVNEEIEKLGGKSGDSKVVGKHTFARPMNKKNDGIYVKMKFEFEPTKVAALNARFTLNDEVFRVQITRPSTFVAPPKDERVKDDA